MYGASDPPRGSREVCVGTETVCSKQFAQNNQEFKILAWIREPEPRGLSSSPRVPSPSYVRAKTLWACPPKSSKWSA